MTSTEMNLALKIFEAAPDLAQKIMERELSLPNIPTPTLGGEVFWNTLSNVNGWRLQQNMFTQHARIIDPDNIRRAWGTINGMYKALDRLVNDPMTKGLSTNEKGEVMDLLLKLKNLYDNGVISKDEYESKKNDYLKRL